MTVKSLLGLRQARNGPILQHGSNLITLAEAAFHLCVASACADHSSVNDVDVDDGGGVGYIRRRRAQSNCR